jgi:predicted phosphodiesterase
VHDVKTIARPPRRAEIDAIISGHSHRPSSERRDGVLYFNPGSAGPRRFKLPIAVGRLRIRKGAIESEIVQLDI